MALNTLASQRHGGQTYYEASETIGNGSIDTGTTNSAVLDLRRADEGVFYFKSTLDAEITVKVFAHPTSDFVEGNVSEWQLGSSFTISDGSTTTQYADQSLTDPDPFVRIEVSGTSDPTAGQLDIWYRGEST